MPIKLNSLLNFDLFRNTGQYAAANFKTLLLLWLFYLISSLRDENYHGNVGKLGITYPVDLPTIKTCWHFKLRCEIPQERLLIERNGTKKREISFV